MRCEPKKQEAPSSSFALSEIIQALVGLKDVQVVHHKRGGRDVELMVEQVPRAVTCPLCSSRAQGKDRLVVHYVYLPVYGYRSPGGSTGCGVRTLVVRRSPSCSRTIASHPRTACLRRGLPSGRRCRSAGEEPSQRWPPSSPPHEARRLLEKLKNHCLGAAMPPEIQEVGRTIKAWFDKICNYRLARTRTVPPKPSTIW